MSKFEKNKNDFDLRAFFNSEKGKHLLEQGERQLRKDFDTNTGVCSPEEDKAWEYLKKEILL